MTDPNPKGKSIPQWQRQQEVGDSSDRSETSNLTIDSDLEHGSDSRSVLLDQAAKFLDHDDIRDSSVERKILFLKEKGLTNEEIQRLLGVSPNGSVSSNLDTSQDVMATVERPPVGNEAAASSPPDPKPSSPPIITYPEFLLHTQRPPPLITSQRILNTLYLTSAAAATIYGTSQYLLNPMLESLTTARHSLFDTTSSNINTLNEKLEKIVSTIPAAASHPGMAHLGEDNDIESETSDPAELFHRDTGTQTSPPRSPRDSLTPTSSTNADATTTPDKQLHSLHNSLSTTLSDSQKLLADDRHIVDELDKLKVFLDDITYSRRGAGYTGIVDTFGKNRVIRSEDEIAKVKAEIKSVKGVLLSAKSFPGGGGGRARSIAS